MKNDKVLEFYLNSTPNDRLRFLNMISKDIIIPTINKDGISQENLWDENPISLNGTLFQLNTEEFGAKIIDSEEENYNADDSILNKPIDWLFPKTSKNQSPALSNRVNTAISWRGCNELMGDKVRTIGDLIQYNRYDILKWKNIGRKGLLLIIESLAKHKLYLKGE